jgi:hypothetical protein
LSGDIFSGNVQANYLKSNANIVSSGIIESIQATNTIDYPNLAGRFIGNVDSYYQLVVQNLSNNANAKSHIKFVSDTGNDTTNYLSVGITNSTGNDPFLNSIFTTKPSDAVIECVGGNVIVGTSSNTFLVAGNALVSLLNSNVFSLSTVSLQFEDGTVQSSAITDVPGLYANIGTLTTNIGTLTTNVAAVDANVTGLNDYVDSLVIDINLLSANVGAFETYIDANVGSLSNIGAQSYTTNNAANYNGTVTNIQQALDQLAARIKALGG